MSDNKAEEIACRAFELDASRRSAFVADKCGGDEPLRQEVLNLLKDMSHVEREQFLDLDRLNSMCPAATANSMLDALEQSAGTLPQGSQRSDHIAPIIKPISQKTSGKRAESRYKLLGEIARGGMGAIIRGHDTDLGRDLVVKVLLDEHRGKPEYVRRFVEEAQIGGQLQHPGIVPVYEIGQLEDARPFFSMKLVKGDTLASHLRNRKSVADNISKYLAIFEQICQTMAYAHSRGVIHRDLKPANIMIGAFGEVQVMDWGLAKPLADGRVAGELRGCDNHHDIGAINTVRNECSTSSDLSDDTGSQTALGSVMGTFAYMPPEQALGDVAALDRRADVFALAGILTEILTGKPPYVAPDKSSVYHMAAQAEQAECLERLDSSGADPKLIAIAKTCLSPEPDARLRDAGALGKTVARHLRRRERRERAELEQLASETRTRQKGLRRRICYVISALAVPIDIIGCWCRRLPGRLRLAR